MSRETIAHLVHPDELDELDEVRVALAAHVEGARETFEAEHRVRTADGDGGGS